jgi:peptidyl-prolyl cis-trans isomerase B (cyclophilin B)
MPNLVFLSFLKYNKFIKLEEIIMKKFICAMLCILLVLSAGCATSNGSGQQSEEDAPQSSESVQQSDEAATQSAAPQSSGKVHVDIDVKDYGTISVELDAANAPISVSNFISLVKDGFYDGLTFHRIMTGFMIQGGDPEGTGTGGSDKTIKGEFSLNGVENPLSHTRGAISMARSKDYDSASSQFFIVHEDSTGLDGQYAVFGYVTDGMDIVDRICADTPVVDNNGTVEKEDQPIITSIKVID